MTILLFARHFDNTDFCEGTCAIEKAAQEQFLEAKHIIEGVDGLYLDRVRYDHTLYKGVEFNMVKLKAESTSEDILIRRIKLTRSNIN